MKLRHEGGYSQRDRESFKEAVFINTVQSMQVILDAMKTLNIRLDELEGERDAQIIKAQPTQIEGDCLPPEVGNAIASLWMTESVQECFKRSHEYQLNDSAK
jgi:guanine nucleotide-binding protein G(i) subunit alpha